MSDPVIDAMRAMAGSAAPAGGRPDLSAVGLVKAYGDRTVVSGISMCCSCGEIVGILGPNGAGKTTTFYMVVGLVRPESGRVEFRGEDITSLPVYVRARNGLGYLAQEPSVFRKLSVWDNVMSILEELPLSRAARKSRAEELLSPFDLMKVAKQPAYTLSGGERRKLEIARALVRDPAILMLDEPFAGVDPLSVSEIQDIVRRLAAKGLGIVITDHNVRETLSVVDRAYMVYNGRLLKAGTAAELVDDPDVRASYLGDGFRMQVLQKHQRKGGQGMSIEVTMRHSDVRIEALKEYAEQRMAKLKEKFPKVTKASIVIDVDVKKHMYMAEVVANRLGEVAVGAKEFSDSAKSVIDTAAARAERQLLRMRVKRRKGTVRKQRAASAKN